jgi:hypothetical protein
MFWDAGREAINVIQRHINNHLLALKSMALLLLSRALTGDLAMSRSFRRTYISYVVALLTVSLLFTWLLRSGIFRIQDSNDQTKALESALTFTATLITASVSLLGVILKTSLDARTLQIQKEAEARQKQAEERLKVEGAIEAMKLLSSSTHSSNGPIAQSSDQTAGVLLLLGDLGRWPLALSLAASMRASRSIGGDTLSWLVNEALHKSNDPDITEQAAILLLENTDALPTSDGGTHFPAKAVDADFLINKTDQATRETLIYSLIDLVVSRDRRKWDQGIYNKILLFLHDFYQSAECKNDALSSTRMLVASALYRFLACGSNDALSFHNKSVGGQSEVNLTAAELQKILQDNGHVNPIPGKNRNGQLREDELKKWENQESAA